MTIKTETRTVEITLNLWRGGWNAGYEPDCFNDLECNFPTMHPERQDDYIIVTTESELTDLIEWWASECATVNGGNEGDCLAALTDEEIERGDEWTLSVGKI